MYGRDGDSKKKDSQRLTWTECREERMGMMVEDDKKTKPIEKQNAATNKDNTIKHYNSNGLIHRSNVNRVSKHIRCAGKCIEYDSPTDTCN